MRNSDAAKPVAVRSHVGDAARDAAGDDAGGVRATFSGDGRSPVRNGLARLAGGIQKVRRAQQDSWTVPGGRERASGPGDADGGAVWTHRGVKDAFGPRFDTAVDADGYAWWYIDALSDDGRSGLTLIAFVGSVFSPYYALSRRFGKTDPNQHCAINVALTGDSVYRWSMTERSKRSMRRGARELVIGSSRLDWNGKSLVADIDETTAPIPRRLKGRIELHPTALTEAVVPLDSAGRHHWSPIAPLSRVDVHMEHPSLSWSGFAYLDSNFGSAPLETAFRQWSWSRTIEQGRTRVLYDVTQASGDETALALEFDERGTARAIEVPQIALLPPTKWRVPRSARGDRPELARIISTWEDGPFYARSLIKTSIGGQRVLAVHESLSLERFSRPIVQAMLPFRMPRRGILPKP
jgi:carotenoid 1,2-hydratase